MTKKLTVMQKVWLKEVNRTGFVERAWRWGQSQSNRPLDTLVALGYIKYTDTHPEDGYYSLGYVPIGDVKE